MVQVRVEGADRLQRLSKELKAAGENGKGLRKELLKQLRAESKPALADVKAAALDLPGKGANPLRRATARAAAIRIRLSGKRVGIKIVIRSSALPEGKERIPRLMNRGKWRHPVFDTDEWVDQRGRKGWFDNPLKGRARHIRRALMRAIEETDRKLKRSL